MSAPYNDPFVTYRFRVLFQNSVGTASAPMHAGFQSVSGLSVSVQTMDYREGDEVTTIVRKVPGLTKVGNVTLKWGMCYDTEDSSKLYSWLAGHASIGEDGPKGGLSLMDINISLSDCEGGYEKTPTWSLKRCYPISFSVPDLNASSNSIAITSMEFAVGAFVFTPPTKAYSEIQTSGDKAQA